MAGKLLVELPAVIVVENDDVYLVMSQSDADAQNAMGLAQTVDKTTNKLSERALPLVQWAKWLYDLRELDPYRPFQYISIP